MLIIHCFCILTFPPFLSLPSCICSGPPTISEDYVSTRVGRAVFLFVTVYGNPAPKIQWMRGNNPVQLDARINQLPNGTLKICDADNADTGKYTISATNSLSAIPATMEITCCGELAVQNWALFFQKIDMLNFGLNWNVIIC